MPTTTEKERCMFVNIVAEVLQDKLCLKEEKVSIRLKSAVTLCIGNVAVCYPESVKE